MAPTLPRPLREREFAKLFTGQAVSALGDGLVPVALAFAVLDATGSASDLGLVLAAQIVPMVALVLLGGVWADRLPRQRLMLASDIVRCGSQALTATLLMTGSARLWELIVLQAVYGMAAAFFRPASTALVPQTVPPDLLDGANALLGLSLNASQVLGPALAGLLVALTGPGPALATDAATFIVSAASLALLRPTPHVPAARTSMAHELAAGWTEFRQRTWLWPVVIYASLMHMLVIAPVMVLGPYVARHSLGGAGAWAIIASGFGVGAVIGGMLAMRVRPARPLATGCALLFAFCGGPALLAIHAPVLAIAAAWAVAGLAAGVANPLFMTALQRHVPAESLSRVSSYDWMGSLLAMPVGYALAGPVAQVAGIPATLAGAAVFGVVATAAVLAVRPVRRLPARPVDESGSAAALAHAA